jgi:hypothetical protein
MLRVDSLADDRVLTFVMRRFLPSMFSTSARPRVIHCQRLASCMLKVKRRRVVGRFGSTRWRYPASACLEGPRSAPVL